MQMHVHNINKGQICAASYRNMWHRGKIIAEPENNHAKVFFVDYGTVENVQIKNLKYLLEKYSQIPAQAYRGSLAYIRPLKHRWTRDSTYSFKTLVEDIILHAHAEEVDLQVNT